MNPHLASGNSQSLAGYTPAHFGWQQQGAGV